MPSNTSNQPNSDTLRKLMALALASSGLLAPNEFKLARYSLDTKQRNQLLDPDICELEDYLIDHFHPKSAPHNRKLVEAFTETVYDICHADDTPIKVSYQHMYWLLMWLNTHTPARSIAENPDSELQILQMCAASGLGEWASTHNQIEEGLHYLLDISSSPLWRVRECAANGLHVMLERSWQRTMRRMTYHSLIANASEWRLLIAACTESPAMIPQAKDANLQHRLLDVYQLLNSCLRYVAAAPTPPDAELTHLLHTLNQAVAGILPLDPDLGFAHLHLWALWDSSVVRQIVQANLTAIPEMWHPQAEKIRQKLIS